MESMDESTNLNFIQKIIKLMNNAPSSEDGFWRTCQLSTIGLFIGYVLAFMLFLAFLIIGFVFLGLPNTRDNNIAQYNTNIATWNTTLPRLEKLSVSYFLPYSGASGNLVPDYQNSDIVPNTRPGDEFSSYQQLKMTSGAIQIYSGQVFSRTDQFVEIKFTISGPSIPTSTILEKVKVFEWTNYPCGPRGRDNCYSSYRLVSIGWTIDLLNYPTSKVIAGGVYSTDRSNSAWLKAIYQDCNLDQAYSLESRLNVRDINDPYYLIDKIPGVGYNIGSTWGLSQVDRSIIAGVILTAAILLLLSIVFFCIVSNAAFYVIFSKWIKEDEEKTSQTTIRHSIQSEMFNPDKIDDSSHVHVKSIQEQIEDSHRLDKIVEKQNQEINNRSFSPTGEVRTIHSKARSGFDPFQGVQVDQNFQN